MMIGLAQVCAPPEPHELPPPLSSVPTALLALRHILTTHNTSLTLMKEGIQIGYSTYVVPAAADHRRFRLVQD